MTTITDFAKNNPILIVEQIAKKATRKEPRRLMKKTELLTETNPLKNGASLVLGMKAPSFSGCCLNPLQCVVAPFNLEVDSGVAIVQVNTQYSLRAYALDIILVNCEGVQPVGIEYNIAINVDSFYIAYRKLTQAEVECFVSFS